MKNLSAVYPDLSAELCSQQDPVHAKSKHEATFYTRNYDKFDQTWTKAQNNDAFQHNSWRKNGSKSLKSL